jgi:8-oxo-dGTP diphosphatase
VRVGAIAVVQAAGRLLMHQRGPDGPGEGTWGLPGGHVEFGEDPAAAAVRECLEETGVLVKAATRLPWHSCYIPQWGTHYVNVAFNCIYLSGDARVMDPREAPAVEWVPLEDVTSLTLFMPLQMMMDAGTLRFPGRSA